MSSRRNYYITPSTPRSSDRGVIFLPKFRNHHIHFLKSTSAILNTATTTVILAVWRIITAHSILYSIERRNPYAQILNRPSRSPLRFPKEISQIGGIKSLQMQLELLRTAHIPVLSPAQPANI